MMFAKSPAACPTWLDTTCCGGSEKGVVIEVKSESSPRQEPEKRDKDEPGVDGTDVDLTKPKPKEEEETEEAATAKEAFPSEAAVKSDEAKVEKTEVKPADPVKMEFIDSKGTVFAKTLVYRPLGIQFNGNASNLTVSGFFFNSHAKAVGVQNGWTILKVGGESLETVRNADDAKSIVRTALQPLKVYPLKLEFRVGNGKGEFSIQTKMFEINQQPLGLSWAAKVPIVINDVKPGGVGARAGIEVGMRLARIAEEDVEVGNYSVIMKKLSEGVNQLDKSG